MAATIEATQVVAPKTPEANFQITMEESSRRLDEKSHDKVDTTEFLSALARRLPSDSGLIPPGLLSVRTGGRYTQLVIQCVPDIKTVCWGESEGKGHEVYPLAMPWRIIIATYTNDTLWGARMFYSPRQVTHLRQPLYHANVPNLNCVGYRGTGVGWLCLYHTGDQFVTLAEKVLYAIDRCSGGEPFNNRNMSSTDGPRFYRATLKHWKRDAQEFKFLWDAEAWASKTEAEGFEWTLDDDLWAPVLVEGIDSQNHHSEKGEPLTLGMAMYGKTKTYYSDPVNDKVYHAFSRADGWDDITRKTLFDSLAETVAAIKDSLKPWRREAIDIKSLSITGFKHPLKNKVISLQVKSCVECSEIIEDGEAFEDWGDGPYCEGCAEECAAECSLCNEPCYKGIFYIESLRRQKYLPEDEKWVTDGGVCEKCYTSFDRLVRKAAVKKMEEAKTAKSVSTSEELF